MRDAAWFEDDAFWELWEPLMFSQARLEGTPAEVDRLVEVLGLEPGDRVLDLPCGVGRHSLELARRGMEVTAVDRTGSYLDRLRARAADEDLDVEVVQADMRQFHREEAFDAAVNLFTSFGYFEDRADDRRVLEGFHASLRPGGGLFLEVLAKEALAPRFRTDVGNILDDGTVVAEHHELRDAWSWIENTWIVVKPDGSRMEKRFGHRLYGARELMDLLEVAGFADVAAYDGFRDAPYDHRAERLGLAAWKPGGGAP